MIEEDIERLREQVEKTQKSLADVGRAFAAAFGDDASMDIYRLQADLESKRRLIDIYKKDYGDLVQEVVETIKLLKPGKGDNGLRKGELLGTVQKYLAARKTVRAAKERPFTADDGTK